MTFCLTGLNKQFKFKFTSAAHLQYSGRSPYQPSDSILSSDIKMLRNLTSAKLNNETIEKLPAVLALQKKKLLVAINKTNETVADISQEDEQLVKDVTKNLAKLAHPTISYMPSQQWNDSEATVRVKATLQKHALFELSKYLDCAMNICEVFLWKECPLKACIGFTLEYALTHARQFGDPSKTIFQVDASANKLTNFEVKLESSRCTNVELSRKSTIVTRTMKQIKELREAYDEILFQALNVSITSFVLLILRRLMKNYSHVHVRSDIYSSCAYLAIEAYLNTEDEKTKKNLQDTCIKFMEWYKMQLPCLFFKVVDVYGIKAGALWDALSSIDSRKTSYTLISLATEYYDNFQLSKTDPVQSQRWFPYCRVFKGDYHKGLSNSVNVCTCLVLSNLIEIKNMCDEPAHKYMYKGNNETMINAWAKQKAAELLRKIIKTT